MVRSLVIALWFIVCITFVAQGQSIRWTSFGQLGDSLRAERKPLLVFIHTDWCKYCNMQLNITFKDAELVGLLNKNYYCLQLDAEATNEVRFINRVYGFQASSGYHELAELLGRKNEELVFPTTVLIDEGFRIDKRLPGLQKAEDLINMLQ